MPSRTSRLLGPAERFYVACSDDDRRELDRVLRNLCIDPLINNKTTFAIIVQPTVMTVFRDGRFWILYRLPDADTLLVYNIGHAPNRPSLR